MQENRGESKTIRQLLSGTRYAVDYYQREYKRSCAEGSELSIYIFNRDGARVHAGAAMGAVTFAEGFFVRRFIASCNSSTSKGFASIMSTFNSS